MLHPLNGCAVGGTGVVQVQTPGQLLPGSEGARVWAEMHAECEAEDLVSALPVTRSHPSCSRLGGDRSRILYAAAVQCGRQA